MENQAAWWIMIIAGTLLMFLAAYLDDRLDKRDKDKLKKRYKNKRNRRKEKRRK